MKKINNKKNNNCNELILKLLIINIFFILNFLL